ncbi:MAG: LCP family protein [Clostridiales bacterium]|nr:LCP family protein [Clostridiales bacterium]
MNRTNNNHNQRRSPARKRKIPVWKYVLAAIVIIIIAAIAFGASFLKLYKPNVDTGVPFETGDKYPDDTRRTDESDNGDTSQSTPAGSFNRDKESVNFLIVGRDVESWNTDVIMLVNFNMRVGSISVMQFPRDTYVITDTVRGRINTAMKMLRADAYSENPSLSQDELLKAGMSRMCELLEKQLCIQIDGYAHMDLAGFRGIVDAIGGVQMDVPYDMDYDDPVQNLSIHIKAGPQVLDGKNAEGLVRFRSGYIQADIGRMDAQKMFLTALFKQLKTSMTVTTIPKLVEQVFKYVTTDVPLADIIIYAKELLGVDMNNISMMTLHGSAVQTDTGAWYYAMNRAATLDMINTYFNVYDTPITDDIFDRSTAFTNKSSTIFTSVYYADPNSAAVEVKPDIQTGQNIDDGDLDIALRK